MKKIFTLLMCIVLTLGVCTTTYASQATMLEINADSTQGKINNSYGIYLDDLSDIGANLVYNGSFDNEEDNLDGWSITGADSAISAENQQSPLNRNVLTLNVNGNANIVNAGKAGMLFKKDTVYHFSFYIYNTDFDGKISVYLNSQQNRQSITELDTKALGSAWRELGAELTSTADEEGTLAIELTGRGTLAIDLVSLVPESSYGYGDKEWKYLTLNNSYFNIIQELNPSFASFDIFSSDTAEWMSYVGAVDARAESKIGSHEYMQLCADAGIKAIPALPDASKMSDSDIKLYAKSAADFIEYANGNATTTYLGALRSANGRAKPFKIKYLGYRGDDSRLAMAVKDLCSGIKLVKLDGAFAYGDDIGKAVQVGADIISKDSTGKRTYIDFKLSELVAVYGNSTVFTPLCYEYMLLSGCGGDELIMHGSDDGIYSLATNDSKNEIIYITLINTTGKKQRVNLSLNGYKINTVSAYSMGSKYPEACNAVGKDYVLPIDEVAVLDGNSVGTALDKYDFTILMVAYGNGSVESFYSLPEYVLARDKAEYIPLGQTSAVPYIAAVAGAVLLLIVALIIGILRKKRNR